MYILGIGCGHKKNLAMLVTAELVYMQYNISDSQTLFRFVLITLRMASLDTLFLCSVEQQAWLCS